MKRVLGLCVAIGGLMKRCHNLTTWIEFWPSHIYLFINIYKYYIYIWYGYDKYYFSKYKLLINYNLCVLLHTLKSGHLRSAALFGIATQRAFVPWPPFPRLRHRRWAPAPILRSGGGNPLHRFPFPQATPPNTGGRGLTRRNLYGLKKLIYLKKIIFNW